MKEAIKNVAIFVILLFACALIYSVNWLYDNFGNLTLNEIIFTIMVPMEGTNTDFVEKYISDELAKILLTTAILFVVIIFPKKKKLKKKHINKHMKTSESLVLVTKKTKILNKIKNIKSHYAVKMLISVIVLAISLNYTFEKTDLANYIDSKLADSKLIEEEYVETSEVNLEFPEQKRNLIYIYLESMEATYYSEELGGAMEENLIEEIADLAQENISFSNSDQLQGMYSVTGTGWTTGAMTAQTTGLPLKLSFIDGNDYGNYQTFLPGVTSIGDILADQGYNQMLMVGSDAEFGGRKNLFKQHGNYQIWDYNTAIEEGRMTADDKVWWGFDDNDLFEYAKEQITNLSEQDEPFNFTMLTADTHHINGYWCENCEIEHDDQYSNVISCSSRNVASFVEWIQEQPFYENTTIVISGDHPSMQPDYFDEIEESGYQRGVVNVFINSAVETENTKNKECSTLDMLPTTLASLGVNIEGNRLGLGTNLFSDEQTIVGKYGLEYLNTELDKTSTFYNKTFLYGK